MTTFVCVLVLSFLSALNYGSQFTVFRGDNLGQEPPGNKPEPFMDGLFSVWGDHGFHLKSSVIFSPQNDAIVFANEVIPAGPGNKKTLWQMFRINDVWREPEIARFSGSYSDDRACYSPSGDTLYFSSTRPVTGKGRAKDFDIYFLLQNPNAGSRPQRLFPPVNTPHNEHCGASTPGGRIYFSSNRPGGKGGLDIYCVQFIDGGGAQLISLGERINTAEDDRVLYVAADETFMIIHRKAARAGAEDGLYVSYKDEQNSWAAAKSMGDHLKVLNAIDASLSPDGMYLFFLSEGNGIYWLKSEIIEYARSEDLEVTKVLINAARKDGMMAALAAYQAIKHKHAGFMDIDEYFLNQRGHQLLNAEKHDDAITIFKIAVELFPDSWNGYDSLGEAYLASGNHALAVHCYERSLELNPRNENAARMLYYLNTLLNN